jgi:serine/threonine-protein kinase RsbW
VFQITLTIESRLDAVPLLAELVRTVCLKGNLSPIEANETEVCVVEAVNNSIKHAYAQETNHLVAVDIHLEPDQIILDIFDSGKSVDPELINRDHDDAFDLDLDHLEGAAESGRGLAIIQEVMDSFEYMPGVNRNRFRLTKRIKES